MHTPQPGELLRGNLRREGKLYGKYGPVSRMLRVDTIADNSDFPAVPLTTRDGQVPEKKLLPGSVLTMGYDHAELARPAEILTWQPRLRRQSSVAHCYGILAPELPLVRSKLREYLSPKDAKRPDRAAILSRWGHVVRDRNDYEYIVLSHNDAAHWRWQARPPAQVATLVAVEIEASWQSIDVTQLSFDHLSTATMRKYSTPTETLVTTAFLDTLTTVDFKTRFLAPWRRDTRHAPGSRFDKFVLALVDLLRSDLAKYLGEEDAGR